MPQTPPRLKMTPYAWLLTFLLAMLALGLWLLIAGMATGAPLLPGPAPFFA